MNQTSNSSSRTSEDMEVLRGRADAGNQHEIAVCLLRSPQMLALTRLLPRASRRCFSSRPAILNEVPPSYHPRPPIRNNFAIDITPDIQNIPRERGTLNSWNNLLGDAVARPQNGEEDTPAARWRAHSARVVPNLQRIRIPDAYTGA